jgi:DNA invertase Pin-like site-specific DNA recombinase
MTDAELAEVLNIPEEAVKRLDNPHANKLTVHILAAVAQNEREIISARRRASDSLGFPRRLPRALAALRAADVPRQRTLHRSPSGSL